MMLQMTDEEIAVAAKNHPNWTVELAPRQVIILEWQGRSFRETFNLMTEIATFAEDINHHPEWCNVYRRLTIRLTTHDVGGLSALDFQMAAFIDEMIERIQRN